MKTIIIFPPKKEKEEKKKCKKIPIQNIITQLFTVEHVNHKKKLSELELG